MNRCGIYKITNIKNNKCYIGSSSKIEFRWNRHRCDLRKNRHSNKHLQNSWNKYFEESFTFECLEIVENIKSKIIEREQYYIDLLKPEYNKRKIAISNLGFRHSEETKKKMSEYKKIHNLKGFKHSDKTRELQSIMRSGERAPSAKLTEEQVREIRKKYIPYVVSYEKLAKEYGIGHSTVEAIITRRSWRRIKD